MMGSWRYYPITAHEARWRPGEPVTGEAGGRRPCPMCGHLVTVSLATSLDSNLDRATLIRHPKLTKTDNIMHGTNKLGEDTYDATYRYLGRF